MEQITLIKRNGTQVKLFSKEPFRTVKTATQSKSLMGVDTVTLSILSREILSFDKGDRIVIKGENYYIRTKVNRELTSDGYFKYDAVFYGVLYDLMKTPYRDMDASGKSTTSTFDLVYTLREYIRVLIYNTNHDYPGWWVFNEAGCPDKDPIALQFSCNNCLEVLQQVCQKFNVDFRITQNNNVRTIQIGHFGSNITPPDGSSYFEWGRGKGLYSLKENKVDDKSIKTRLWVEGGTSNLPTGYRDYAMRLQLPMRRVNKNSHTLSDGTVISAGSEYIGISSENERYIEDSTLSSTIGVDADSKLYDDIVPTKTGTVTAVDNGDEETETPPDINTFFDSYLDFDINDHLVNNVSAKITFISGKLAGQTLEIGKYVHDDRKITIIPFQDSRGLTIPTEGNNTAFRIAVGDRYKLTDVIMPQSVIDDAEENLWYAGYDDLLKLKQTKVQYSMELNRMRLLELMPTDSDTVLFKPGDYLPIKDTRFNVQKYIRIQKVERNLLLRHDYKLTISDTASIDVITQAVVDTNNHEVIIVNNGLRDLSKMKRGWRTTEELRNMVFDTDGYFDTDNFRANSIDTNMLTVGSKSQQFVLVGVVIQPNYGGNKDRIVITAGTLVHLTISDTEFRSWEMSAADVTMENATGYYLYARCKKKPEEHEEPEEGEEPEPDVWKGTWLVTQQQFRADPEGDYYYFQVGIIGSAYAATGSHTAFRDFVTTYGFTRINGNTITTGKIVTSDGYNYLDLDGAKFRIGDANSSFDFNVTARNQITLRNVKLMSGTAEDPVFSDIGVYRGVFNPNYYYYYGDEVSYTSGGATATYRYINPQTTKGHLPTESAYWEIVAKGANGADGADGSDGTRGNFKSRVFKRSNTTPDTPSGGTYENPVPSGWSDGVPGGTSILWSSVCTFYGGGGSSGWSTPAPETDTDTLDIEFSPSTTQPAAPTGDTPYSDHESEGWYDPSSPNFPTAGTMIWRAERKVSNGEYDGEWTISRIYGEKGDKGQSSFKSTMFVRMNNTPTKPATNKGSFLDPSPSNCLAGQNSDNTDVYWSDGIPSGTNKLWATSRIFSSDGASPQQTSWSTPRQMTDTDTYDVEFSNVNTNPGNPTDNPNNWHDPSESGVDFTSMVWRAERECKNGVWGSWIIVRIKGERGNDGYDGNDGSDGLNGDFFEYRYAKNGSTSTPPTLNTSSRTPSGWSTSVPTVGALEYLWMTVAKISGQTNTLLQTWSTPVRITPYDGVDGEDGKDGKSPVMVFRGNFDGSKTYYGTQYRVDAVKYNGSYYVCRIDAGSFTGSSYVPTNTDKWNSFGAEFESIATNLLLAEGASIGNWWHSGGKIVSTLGTGNKIELDATTPRIYLESATSGGSYSEQTGLGSKIELNADTGVVQVTAKNAPSYSTGTAYMSPTGIFANLAGTQAVSSVTGYTRRAAMVALGYGSVSKSSWSLGADEAMIAGVYGMANNNSNAPAYGGYFHDLKACGFLFYTKYIGDSTSGTDLYVNKNVSQVISVTNPETRKNVYLPNDGYEGRVIFFHQMGGGGLRVYPQYGQHIYDDTSENSYYDVDEGETLMAIFGIWYKNSVKTEVWIVRKFKFL